MNSCFLLVSYVNFDKLVKFLKMLLLCVEWEPYSTCLGVMFNMWDYPCKRLVYVLDYSKYSVNSSFSIISHFLWFNCTWAQYY